MPTFVSCSRIPTFLNPTWFDSLFVFTQNHLQLLSVMLFFNVKWPKTIIDMFGGLKAISTGGSEALSPDCLLDGGSDREGVTASLVVEWGSRTYVRSFMTAITPLVAIVLMTLFWRLRTPCGHCMSYTFRCCAGCRVKNGNDDDGSEDSDSDHPRPRSRKLRTRVSRLAQWLVLTGKAIRQRNRVSILVMLFIFHLSLVQGALSLFICDDLIPLELREGGGGDGVDGDGSATNGTCYDDGSGGHIQYLQADPTVRCWESTHRAWALALGLPMLILYGIGIPLYGFVNLYHRRKKLDTEQCRQVYGFMYVRKCAQRLWH